MRLGEIIENYRTKNDMSLSQFSQKSGISKPYIHLLEKGTHPQTGKPIHPSVDKIQKAAIGMDMDFDTLFKMIDEYITLETDEEIVAELERNASLKIPVLGRVAAGIPIDAIEDVIDYIFISPEIVDNGDFYGLKIKGDSMEPYICDGDTVVVMMTSTAELNDIVIATLDNDDVVCKKYIKRGEKTFLHSLNPVYEDIDVTNNPNFKIRGIAIELRRDISSHSKN